MLNFVIVVNKPIRHSPLVVDKAEGVIKLIIRPNKELIDFMLSEILETLKAAGLLSRMGSNKNGKWIVEHPEQI